MTSADRSRRERLRLLSVQKRAHSRRAWALASAVRTADRLAELDAELKAAADGLAELDAGEDREASA